MARADFYAVQCAIGQRLAMNDALAEAGLTVLIEQQVSPRRGWLVNILFDSYEVPADLQGINSGTRMRMHTKYVIQCYVFNLKIERAMELRDDLMGKVGTVLMGDPRTFGRDDVRSSWQQGGEAASGETEGGGMFFAMGEIILIVDMESTT